MNNKIFNYLLYFIYLSIGALFYLAFLNYPGQGYAYMLSQVVAYRYAHFGYVPGQSYLLFGTLGLNVVMIFLLNRFLLFYYKKPCRAETRTRL